MGSTERPRDVLTRSKPWLIALAGVVLFAALVVGSRPFANTYYNDVSDRIRHLRELDTRVDEAVLMSRYGLRGNYDELVHLSAESEEVVNEIRTLIDNDGTRDPATRRALTTTIEQQQRQVAIAERFKSVNSVLLNSLAYLPLAAAEVEEEVRKGQLSAEVGRAADVLVHGIMEEELPTPSQHPVDIERQIELLRPHDGDPLLHTLLAHAQLLLRYRPDIDKMIAALLDASDDVCYNQLFEAIRSLHDGRVRRGNYFRSALALFCAFLMVVVVRMFYQLRSNALDVAARQQEVEVLNEELEQRVAERTRAVSDTNAILRAKMRELTETRKQLASASRLSGMAEVASSVLHNVGNVLNSVNVSAMLLRESVVASKSKGVGRVAQLLAEHEADLGHFITVDDKGKTLPRYLTTLGAALNEEQATLLRETDALRRSIDHIKVVISRQQYNAKASGILEQASLNDIVDDAITCQDSSLERHGVELVRDYGDLPRSTLDRHRLIEILVNLLGNARHAVAEQTVRRITVRTGKVDGAKCFVEVEDTGYGIDQANLVRIFNHGFTTKRDGHGFGLHGSACVAGELGGRLTVRSDGPGQGACFRLEIPMMAQAQDKKPDLTPSHGFILPSLKITA